MVFEKKTSPLITTAARTTNNNNGHDDNGKNKIKKQQHFPPDGNLFDKKWSTLKLLHHQKYLSYDKFNCIKCYCQTITANCPKVLYSHHINNIAKVCYDEAILKKSIIVQKLFPELQKMFMKVPVMKGKISMSSSPYHALLCPVKRVE